MSTVDQVASNRAVAVVPLLAVVLAVEVVPEAVVVVPEAVATPEMTHRIGPQEIACKLKALFKETARVSTAQEADRQAKMAISRPWRR